jgi:hypothetical protein
LRWQEKHDGPSIVHELGKGEKAMPKLQKRVEKYLVEKIKQRCAACVPQKQVAIELGISLSTVVRYERVCGCKRARGRPAVFSNLPVSDIVAYLEDDHTIRETMKHFRSSAGRIKKMLRNADRHDLIDRYRNRIRNPRKKRPVVGVVACRVNKPRNHYGPKLPARENELTCGNYLWCLHHHFLHDMPDSAFGCTGCRYHVAPTFRADPVMSRFTYTDSQLYGSLPSHGARHRHRLVGVGA